MAKSISTARVVAAIANEMSHASHAWVKGTITLEDQEMVCDYLRAVAIRCGLDPQLREVFAGGTTPAAR